MKYQKGHRGLHSLQVNIWLDKLSPHPCLSHSFLAKIQTNLRNRLDHTLLLGICSPQPGLSWSGSHRVNSGDELFYTQSHLSLTQRPYHCSLTLALTNSSSTHKTNISLFSESRFWNWSFEVGGTAQTWARGSGIVLHAQFDKRDKVWLNTTLAGRCLQTTAGFMNGQSEHIVCRHPSSQSAGLFGEFNFSGGTGSALEFSNQSQATGESQNNAEYLTEFRQQSRDSEVVQEFSSVSFHALKRLEVLLYLEQADLLVQWQKSTARHFLTENVPQFLNLLQHASLLGQQELRSESCFFVLRSCRWWVSQRLSFFKHIFYLYIQTTCDSSRCVPGCEGQRLEALWREAVSLWTETVGEVLPVDSPQLLPLVRVFVTGLRVTVDVAGQQSYQWLESRLALALSGVRKRLTSVYKFSPRACMLSVNVPLPQLHWPGTNEAELVQTVLEEWLFKPLQSLASIRPTAELYRLKRKIMDSPFIYQALLVSDQFVVTYDNNVYELPSSCPLLLARSISADPFFTLILNPNINPFVLIEMNNNNISIQLNGQVKVNCHTLTTNTFFVDNVSLKDQQSLTLDGWLHGTSTGLMGTNDNEAGNDFVLPNGSYTKNHRTFISSWKITPDCSESPVKKDLFLSSVISPVSCDYLFSSLDSPLSSCFRVVDPSKFLSVCQKSFHKEAPCRLLLLLLMFAGRTTSLWRRLSSA
ncbi:hypothetical protein WMY93_001541 [Mugilogobius chulae]|uniref:VWFD domain-containing protein n=1 Tax=Mugilogobius chulae TaxID=88201 RepID=A0AAW0QAQ3_9GOBI